MGFCGQLEGDKGHTDQSQSARVDALDSGGGERKVGNAVFTFRTIEVSGTSG